MTKILVATPEDHTTQLIVGLITACLGFSSFRAEKMEEVVELAMNYSPDLILLDYKFINIITILSDIEKLQNTQLVLMTPGKMKPAGLLQTPRLVVLPKPEIASIVEFIAGLKAAISTNYLEVGGLILNLPRHLLSNQDHREILLTQSEVALLYELMARPNHCYGYEYLENLLFVNNVGLRQIVSSVRKKLLTLDKLITIVSIRSEGYLLKFEILTNP